MANKRNTAIKMASRCLERLRHAPEGWLHLVGVRMLMLRLFQLDKAVKKKGVSEISAVTTNVAIT